MISSRVLSERFIQLRAGEYHLALPLIGVQKIIALGVQASNPSAAGKPLPPNAISLARVLGAKRAPDTEPCLLRLVGQAESTLVSCCEIEGFWEAESLEPMSGTVGIRWPGLIRGLMRKRGRWIVVLEPAILVGVLEGWIEYGTQHSARGE